MEKYYKYMTKVIDMVKKGEMFKWKGTVKKLREELKRTREHDKKLNN